MSQSHLVIDFPIKGLSNASALTEELPPLMPDFATAQDDLGTVHFSRFMVKGDEKLLFLSDIDGEIGQHIERLVESVGPVLDAIFQHVDEPPATPVANDPLRAIKWLKNHVREPVDTYFAYEDASVQDIKESARIAGITGTTSQAPLLTYMSIKSRLQGFALKLAVRSIREDSYEASDSRSGRSTSPTGCPSSTITSASSRSTTVTWRSTSRTSPEKTSRALRCTLPTRRRRAADAGRKERSGVLSVGSGQQLSGHRLLQRLSRPRRFKTSEPFWPTANRQPVAK